MRDAGVIDERRQRVSEALVNRSPRLAGMYRMALDMIAKGAVLGCESARISSVCHCMRELMSGLPAVMTEISIPRPNPSSGSLLQRLPGLLASHPDASLGLDQDLVPVPREVARVLSDLVSTLTREAGRNRTNTAALVTGDLDAKHPAIAQWSAAYDYFLNWTHLDRNHDQGKRLPNDDALLARIRIVEDVIEVRSALFFENIHAIEDLLAVINKIDEEDAI